MCVGSPLCALVIVALKLRFGGGAGKASLVGAGRSRVAVVAVVDVMTPTLALRLVIARWSIWLAAGLS